MKTSLRLHQSGPRLACAIMLAVSTGLAACGQRGPLYLPQPATAKPAPSKPAGSNLPSRADDDVRNPPANDSKPAEPGR